MTKGYMCWWGIILFFRVAFFGVLLYSSFCGNSVATAIILALLVCDNLTGRLYHFSKVINRKSRYEIFKELEVNAAEKEKRRKAEEEYRRSGS